MHEDPVTKSKRVTNSAGAIVSTIELDPWGADTPRSNNAAFQPKKYTSYDRDGNASDEAMFRRYNRWQSRFDQPDPYDGSYSLTNPQSFNRYAYVQNDPVNFVDPTGLFLCLTCPSDDGVDPPGWRDVWDASNGGPGLTPPGGPHGDPSRGGGGGGLGHEAGQNTGKKPPCPPLPQAPPGADIDANIKQEADSLNNVKTLMKLPNGEIGDRAFKAGLMPSHVLNFALAVMPHGPWDYKREGQGEQYEAFGNFHFGATAAAAGFTEGRILRGAGFIQKHFGDSPGDGGAVNLANVLSGQGGDAPFEDQVRDQENIKAGINYYNHKFVLQDCQ